MKKKRFLIIIYIHFVYNLTFKEIPELGVFLGISSFQGWILDGPTHKFSTNDSKCDRILFLILFIAEKKTCVSLIWIW